MSFQPLLKLGLKISFHFFYFSENSFHCQVERFQRALHQYYETKNAVGLFEVTEMKKFAEQNAPGFHLILRDDNRLSEEHPRENTISYKRKQQLFCCTCWHIFGTSFHNKFQVTCLSSEILANLTGVSTFLYGYLQHC